MLKDPIVSFTWIWAQVSLLSTFKDITPAVADPVNNLVTLVTVACCVVGILYPKNTLLLVSAASFLNLVITGARSNHVLMQLAFNCVILISGVAHLRYPNRAWLAELVAHARFFIFSVYFWPLLHKLNTTFFDPRVSCSSMVSGIVLSQYSNLDPSSPLVSAIIDFSPYLAIFTEAWFSIILSLGAEDSWVFKMTWYGGVLFHLFLAIPLSPASFYPFSVLMLAVYFLLRPRPCAAALQDYAMYLVPLFIALHLGGFSWSKAVGEVRFEYPAYDMFDGALLWISCYSLLFLISLRDSAETWLEARKTPRLRWPRYLLMPIVLSAIALGPYLGLRTYAALAMFSNLRVEHQSNHLFLPTLPSVMTDTVEVLETDISRLRYFTVDLMELYPQKSLDYLKKTNISYALWICPPEWPASAPSTEFRAYSIPVVELQRVLSTTTEDGFVRFRRNSGSKKIETFTRKGSHVSDTALVQPLPWYYRFFLFRAFDPATSLCRH